MTSAVELCRIRDLRDFRVLGLDCLRSCFTFYLSETMLCDFAVNLAIDLDIRYVI